MANKKPKNMLLKDTGERMIPQYSKGKVVYGEHLVRYSSISELVRGKVVLDIASGSGYGTKIISDHAKKVFGVDIEKDAVEYAKQNYSNKNIDFIVGDGEKIPLEDNSVDVVVSFETIEHIENYNLFIDEVKRVMKSDGLLILSTPNDIEYSEDNHFHLHEFTLDELKKLLKANFTHCKVYQQANWVYSGIFSQDDLEKEWGPHSIRTTNLAPIDVNKSIYFIALASFNEIEEGITKQAILSEHWSARRNRENEMILKKHMDEQAKIIEHLQSELNHGNEVVSSLEEQLNIMRSKKISNRIKVAARKIKKTK